MTREGRRVLMRDTTPESAQLVLVSQAEGMELTSRGAKVLLPSWENRTKAVLAELIR